MATHRIPNENFPIQLNLNDTLGDIVGSFNLDLHTNMGKMKLARPMKSIRTDAQLDGNPLVANGVYKEKIFFVTEDSLLQTDVEGPLTGWTTSTTNNGWLDAVVFDDTVVISKDGDVDYYDGVSTTEDWWTDRSNPALTTGFPHIMETSRIGEETLYITDNTQIHGYTGLVDSDSGAVRVTMDIDDSFTANCIKSGIRKVWVGAYSRIGEQARVFEWDGASTNYTQSFPVGSNAVLAMELVNDTPLVITDRGEFKLFDGVSFSTVAQFPFWNKAAFPFGVSIGSVSDVDTERPIHPKGVWTKSNIVYVFVNFRPTGTPPIANLPIEENTPSGVWAFNIDTKSLSHLCSPLGWFSLENSSPVMAVNNSTGRIFCGGSTDGGSALYAEDLDPDTENTGYLITREFETDSVTDSVNEIVVKALLGQDDEITVKYRTRKDVLYPVYAEDVAWSDADVFNTTQDLSAVLARFQADDSISDEVQLLTGTNAGMSANITNIQKSTNVYTVTLDTEIGTIGETSNIKIDNWQKFPDPMTFEDGDHKRFGLSDVSTFSQFKVILSGKAGYPEIRGILINTTNKEGKK